MVALTFQFVPAKSLTALLGPGNFKTTYSGTITTAAVPEPSTVVMAFTALPLLGLGYWRRRRQSRV